MNQISSPAEVRSRMRADASFRRRALYSQMALIRHFEERALKLFDSNELFGTTHCCIGQEADAAGVINHLQPKDIVWSPHRCHGHFLVWADRPDLLMAELMGRASGLCGGRGGSQHLCYQNFYSNGVQGGIVPTGVGMAMAEKIKGSGAIAVVFLGDGTLGEGAVYEAFNLASLWNAPVLFVLENNRWAQSTPVEKELAGSMKLRGSAFGIDSGEIESTDAEELFTHFGPIVETVRREQRPRLEIIHTYRLCHHSKSDDARPEEEVARYRAGDPLPKLRARLLEAEAREIESQASERIEQAVIWARSQPFPSTSSVELSQSSAAEARP